MGAGFKNEIYEFLFPAIALDVEFSDDYFSYLSHIAVADMSLVVPRVNGYTIGTETLRVHCCFKYIWIITSARIAKGSNFIDVYGEFDHGSKNR